MALVVIGGVAAGLSAAARARRVDPRLEIVVLEKGPAISYGACGLPYFVEGRVRQASQLTVYTPEYFRKERKIDVRTGARVVSISHPRREVKLESGARVAYDRLVIATGARCDTLGIQGAAQAHVFTLHTLDDGERMRAFLRERQPKRAVVIGGGYIGVEIADALRRNGVGVTLLERSQHLLLRDDALFTAAVRKQLEMHGVEVRCGAEAKAIEADRVDGRELRHGGGGGGVPSQRGTGRGGGNRDRPQRRHPHRRAHGDQSARRVRGGRLRRNDPPGNRPAHLHSARYHGQQVRPRGRRQRRWRTGTVSGHCGNVDRGHLRNGVRDHRFLGRRRRAPKASRRWPRASKPTPIRGTFRGPKDHRGTGGRPQHAPADRRLGDRRRGRGGADQRDCDGRSAAACEWTNSNNWTWPIRRRFRRCGTRC